MLPYLRLSRSLINMLVHIHTSVEICLETLRPQRHLSHCNWLWGAWGRPCSQILCVWMTRQLYTMNTTQEFFSRPDELDITVTSRLTDAECEKRFAFYCKIDTNLCLLLAKSYVMRKSAWFLPSNNYIQHTRTNNNYLRSFIISQVL